MPHESEIIIRSISDPVAFKEGKPTKIRFWYIPAGCLLVGFLIGLAF